MNEPIKPTSQTSQIIYGSGDINIARFQRITNPTNPQEAYALYAAGTGVTSSTGYNYNISLFNNGSLYSSYTY